MRCDVSRARAENSQAKDKLAAVKARVKTREETLARGHDEEDIIRARINLVKAEVEREKEKRFKDVASYQSEVLNLCGQLRQASISGGSLAAVEEKKESLLKELKEIEQELAGFHQEEHQEDLVLEDWTGLQQVIPGSLILQPRQLWLGAHLTGGNTRFCRESGRCSDYLFLTQMCPL